MDWSFIKTMTHTLKSEVQILGIKYQPVKLNDEQKQFVPAAISTISKSQEHSTDAEENLVLFYLSSVYGSFYLDLIYTVCTFKLVFVLFSLTDG